MASAGASGPAAESARDDTPAPLAGERGRSMLPGMPTPDSRGAARLAREWLAEQIAQIRRLRNLPVGRASVDSRSLADERIAAGAGDAHSAECTIRLAAETQGSVIDALREELE